MSHNEITDSTPCGNNLCIVGNGSNYEVVRWLSNLPWDDSHETLKDNLSYSEALHFVEQLENGENYVR